MKKRTIVILAVSILAILAVVIGLTATGKGNAKLIDIEASAEAKAMTEMLLESGDAEILEEGVFDAVVPYLYERGEQEFPDVDVENTLGSFELDGSKIYTLGKDDSSNIVLYIHGGAWTFEIDSAHVAFCDMLASSMDAIVYMPLYPLAPQNTCDITYDMLYKLYSQLAGQGKKVYVMGDSAGGNMTLGLTYMIKEKGDTMPDALVTISPCADMTFSNPAIVEVEKNDPSLRIYGSKACAQLWAGGKALDDPIFSAINADVSGYPKIMIFAGTNDIIYPDAMLFYEKLADADVEVTFIRAEGLFHVFPLYDIPERDYAIEQITEFCK